MEIQTNRLRLTEAGLTNLHQIHELLSFPETDQYNTLGIPKSVTDTENLLLSWIADQNEKLLRSYVFSIELPEDGSFIGLIALILGKPKYQKGEVWFKLHKNYWRKGFASESLNAILQFGFDTLKLHRIEAGCATENLASAKTLEKCGMTREGMKRKHLPIRGEWKDNYLYGILEEEFKSGN